MSQWIGRAGFRGGEEGTAMRKLWHDPAEEKRVKHQSSCSLSSSRPGRA